MLEMILQDHLMTTKNHKLSRNSKFKGTPSDEHPTSTYCHYPESQQQQYVDEGEQAEQK